MDPGAKSLVENKKTVQVKLIFTLKVVLQKLVWKKQGGNNIILTCKKWTTIKHCISKYTNTPNGRGHTPLELSLKGACRDYYFLWEMYNNATLSNQSAIFWGSLTIVHGHETEKKRSVVGAIFRWQQCNLIRLQENHRRKWQLAPILLHPLTKIAFYIYKVLKTHNIL